MSLATNAEALAVASRSLDTARCWAYEHNVPRYYGSYQELLEDPEVDAIYIALPPTLHHQWTLRAAEAGKHVLCEKPLAVDGRQAEEMASACGEHRVLLMDGVMWVHHDRTAEMQQHLSPDSLGTIRRATAAFCFNFGPKVPMDNIRVRPELGGGCLGDLGWYCVRGIWWAFGGAIPERVFATARYFNSVTYNLSATMWFPGERMASFDCGFDIGMRQWIEVAGTERSLVCDDYVLPTSEHEARWWIHEPSGRSNKHMIANCVQEQRMIEHFSSHVLENTPNPHWVAEAVITQKICDALEQSARRETIVEIN